VKTNADRPQPKFPQFFVTGSPFAADGFFPDVFGVPRSRRRKPSKGPTNGLRAGLSDDPLMRRPERFSAI